MPLRTARQRSSGTQRLIELAQQQALAPWAR
jgi:hypothetical protein